MIGIVDVLRLARRNLELVKKGEEDALNYLEVLEQEEIFDKLSYDDLCEAVLRLAPTSSVKAKKK